MTDLGGCTAGIRHIAVRQRPPPQRQYRQMNKHRPFGWFRGEAVLWITALADRPLSAVGRMVEFVNGRFMAENRAEAL